MERFAREQAPERAERTDTLVWGKNAVTELLKSGGAVDTVYLTDTMPQAVAGYRESGFGVTALVRRYQMPAHCPVENASLDDIMLYSIKGKRL